METQSFVSSLFAIAAKNLSLRLLAYGFLEDLDRLGKQWQWDRDGNRV
jgi:hypothetical protein